MKAKCAPLLVGFFISMATGSVKADTFNYSFTNLANGGGTVTGTIILDAADTMTTACANCHDKWREKPTLADRCK